MHAFDSWTLAPFPLLVLAIAALPLVAPHLWERRATHVAVTLAASLPVAWSLLHSGAGEALGHSLSQYASFICTLLALYVAAGGVFATGDIEATPRNNALFLLTGSVLASAIGTTGASVLVLRPLLRTNSDRTHKEHLVPFFILCVANAGGLLTPLGDPPLLVGFLQGVPFFWTLKLFPVWLLYVGSIVLAFYVTDRRAYAREAPSRLRADRTQVVPLTIAGKRNLVWLLAIVGAAFLPAPVRELALLGIAAASYFGTPRALHTQNGFSFGPILEVAILFVGLFVCLVPVEHALAQAAPTLPVRQAWQLFWVSGLLSSVLDNAPTYAAFAALARGLSTGGSELVAGITPIKLAALSAGTVLMGATTYIGNGPNLMVKAIAERSGLRMPSFFRYAAFALIVLMPAHLVLTAALVWLER